MNTYLQTRPLSDPWDKELQPNGWTSGRDSTKTDSVPYGSVSSSDALPVNPIQLLKFWNFTAGNKSCTSSHAANPQHMYMQC